MILRLTGLLTMRNLTLANGSPAVRIRSGSLHIENATFSGNNFDLGGAITTEGGSVSIESSTFSGNIAIDGLGGAIWIGGGSVSIDNSTFWGTQW